MSNDVQEVLNNVDALYEKLKDNPKKEPIVRKIRKLLRSML